MQYKKYLHALYFLLYFELSICILLQQLEGYIPGQDYPVYNEVPQGLAFRCDQRLPGYYSDPEAQCQVNTYNE